MKDMHECYHLLLPHYYLRRILQTAVTIKSLCKENCIPIGSSPDDSEEVRVLKGLLNTIPDPMNSIHEKKKAIPRYNATVEELRRPDGVRSDDLRYCDLSL